MKRIYAIGGGEIKNKETLELDRFLANKAKEHAGENVLPVLLRAQVIINTIILMKTIVLATAITAVVI